MLGILGVPEVTAHNPEAPFEPIEGGVLDLEYRDWRDGQYDGVPGGGDILPEEFASGVTAADKQFDFVRNLWIRRYAVMWKNFDYKSLNEIAEYQAEVLFGKGWK